MRKPYQHEYGHLVHKFKNTSCYTNLTSRILSAARGGSYYGPSEGQYTGRWCYEPRSKCKCHDKQQCDAIRQDLYLASTKSSCLIPDQATLWYGRQKQKRKLMQSLKNMSPKDILEFQCLYQSNFQYQSPPPRCLDLKMPIRSVPCVPYQVGSAIKRISPEFLELLKQHDLRQRQRSVLNCLPADYTNRRVKPQTEPEKIHCCLDGFPCCCGTDASPTEGKKGKKGLFHKLFCSQSQMFPGEDNDYSCCQDSAAKKMPASGQSRITIHKPCPPAVCTKETCPFRCKEPKKKWAIFSKPRVHGFGAQPKEEHNEEDCDNISGNPNLRPRVHVPGSPSVNEIWTKPNATQMRESTASLRPRYYIPKGSRYNENYDARPKAPPVPPKPGSYVLGQWRQPEMTNAMMGLKRTPGLRTENHDTDWQPRYHGQEDCLHAEQTPQIDNTNYPSTSPRYQAKWPDTTRYGGGSWKRAKSPKMEAKPKWVVIPKMQPKFKDGKTICDKESSSKTHHSYANTRPRFHCISSDSSPDRYGKRNVPKISSGEVSLQPSLAKFKSNTTCKVSESDSSPVTARQVRYRLKKKPNADDTTDDSDRQTKYRKINTRSAHRLRDTTSKDTTLRGKMSGVKGKTNKDVQNYQEDRLEKSSQCDMTTKAPVGILKGHRKLYQASKHAAVIPCEHPPSYVDSDQEQTRTIGKTKKRRRFRMRATSKECSNTEYVSARKSLSTMVMRYLNNEPQKLTYRKRSRTKIYYKSSSGGESECTTTRRKLAR